MTAIVEELLTKGLRPLFLACWPESGCLGHFTELISHNSFYGVEVAVSFSAAERGLGRRLAKEYPVFFPATASLLFHKLSNFDLVVVCPLSLNTLAKFALGIQDSFPSSVLASAASVGVPILLDDSNLPMREGSTNPHLIRMYLKHWDQVIGGRVHQFTAPDLSQILLRIQRNRRQLAAGTTANPLREVITRDDVIAAYNAMQPLLISRRAIITPLARDEAKDLGVTLQFQE